MHLDAGCRLAFHVSAPAPFVLMLRPRSGAAQWVREDSYELSPSVQLLEYVDAPATVAALAGMGCIAAIRLAAIFWNLTLPVFTLSDHGPSER